MNRQQAEAFLHVVQTMWEREEAERRRRKDPATWLRARLDTSAWPMAHELVVTDGWPTRDEITVGVVTMPVSYRTREGQERHLTRDERRFNISAYLVREEPRAAIVLAQRGLEQMLREWFRVEVKPERKPEG